VSLSETYEPVDGLEEVESIAKGTIAEIETSMRAQMSEMTCPHLFSIPNAAA